MIRELRYKGHEVDIFLLPWDAVDVSKSEGLYVKATCFHGGNSVFSLLGKWFFSSFKFIPVLLRNIIRRERYDLIVSFSPNVIFAPVLLFSRIFVRSHHCVYWDFFPIHNYEIGMPIPKRFLKPLRAYENFINNRFDKIFLMSPRNVEFYKQYFGNHKGLDVLPLWRNVDGLKPKAKQKSLAKTVRFVFGGQLVEGRGIAEMLEAFSQALAQNPHIRLSVLGAGKLSELVKDYSAKTNGAVEYVGHVDRDSYMDYLSSCDVGVVSTVPGVSAPSYPSKALDYMAASLPLAISVEPSSDFGFIAKDNEYGLFCDAGNIDEFKEIFLRFSEDGELRESYGRRGFDYLLKHHDVGRIADKLISQVK